MVFITCRSAGSFGFDFLNFDRIMLMNEAAPLLRPRLPNRSPNLDPVPAASWLKCSLPFTTLSAANDRCSGCPCPPPPSPPRRPSSLVPSPPWLLSCSVPSASFGCVPCFEAWPWRCLCLCLPPLGDRCALLPAPPGLPRYFLILPLILVCVAQCTD